MFKSAASPSTQSEEIKNPITSLITSPALGAWCLEAVRTALGEGSSDLPATSAQCENVAPVIDCEPTHATICSGGGVSGLANGDVVGDTLSDNGGGHVVTEAGAWASLVATSIQQNTSRAAHATHRRRSLLPAESSIVTPSPLQPSTINMTSPDMSRACLLALAFPDHLARRAEPGPYDPFRDVSKRQVGHDHKTCISARVGGEDADETARDGQGHEPPAAFHHENECPAPLLPSARRQ
jgi:hypothetical protein